MSEHSTSNGDWYDPEKALDEEEQFQRELDEALQKRNIPIEPGNDEEKFF